MSTTTVFEELRALLTRCSPMPWRVSFSGYAVKSIDASIVAQVHPAGMQSDAVFERWMDNSELIVEAVNRFSDLLKVAEAARAVRKVDSANAKRALDAALSALDGDA